MANSRYYRLFWRTTRRWLCHNHKLYYSYMFLCKQSNLYKLYDIGAIGMYQLYYSMIVGYYVRKNYHRSLEYAIMRETEWQKNKPADEDDDDMFDDEEEEGGEEGGDEEE